MGTGIHRYWLRLVDGETLWCYLCNEMEQGQNEEPHVEVVVEEEVRADNRIGRVYCKECYEKNIKPFIDNKI